MEVQKSSNIVACFDFQRNNNSFQQFRFLLVIHANLSSFYNYNGQFGTMYL